jgi:hypothetical protein
MFKKQSKMNLKIRLKLLSVQKGHNYETDISLKIITFDEKIPYFKNFNYYHYVSSREKRRDLGLMTSSN